MDEGKKIDIAADAVGALIAALDAHLMSAGRKRRKAAIKEADRQLNRLKMACNPNVPFTWSLHSLPSIDAGRETKENVKAGLREMVERMGQGQSVGYTAQVISDGLANRYLERFGTLIDVPELPQLFSEHCQGVEHGR